MKAQKGQMFSAELMLAYMVFTIVLVIIIYLWTSTTRDILGAEGTSDMESTAVDVSEGLMRTTGSPEGWDKDNVQSTGLANASRNLQEDKILSFVDLMDPARFDNSCSGGLSNYECNKHLTGVGVYDFYLSIEYLNATNVSDGGKTFVTGKPPSGGTQKVTMLRTGLLNTTIVRMRVVVWI
jgi:hypothetical protein